MQQGALIHAFCEQIQWLDDTPPDASQLVEVARRMDADEQHIQHSLVQFQAMISRPEIQSLLSREYYTNRIQTDDGRQLELEVCREQPVMVTADERLVFGSIDRLVLFKDGLIPVAADIVDFKTDAIRNQDELTARVAHYRPQLEAYVCGIQRMLQIDAPKISARLVFLSSGKVVPL